ncbi:MULTISPECIES: hypothetical protein [unclassified Butyrivibrio]|uniref:hypothetical protein n=1 Tax=unclassified Butyrivibrio TaxID=2639466 RepID=UPI0004794CD2|nr:MULTISPECIES: hypothetical protein [unclassified Butyrivibrio]
MNIGAFDMTKVRRSKMIPWILAAFSLGFAIYYINYNYYTLMNGDTSSELVLSKLLADEGGILAKNWFYSTELRVINTQLIYKLVFMFIPNNWKAVRIASDIVMLLLLAVCYQFMMKALGYEREGKWTLWMLFLPFGASYGYMIVYSAFYIPHICLTFLSVGLMSELYKATERRSKIIYLSSLLIVALLAGLGGARQALICYIPAVLVGMVELVNNYLMNQKKPYKLFLITVLAFLSYLMGMAVNYCIFRSVYHFRDQVTYQWKEISIGNFLQTISDLFSLYGFCFNDVSFMGIYGAVNFLALGFCTLIVACVIILFSKIKELDFLTRFYLLFTALSIVFCGFVYSICIDQYSVTYWIPLMTLLYPILFITKRVIKNEQVSKVFPLITGYLIVTFCLVSKITVKNPFESRLPFVPNGSNYMVVKDIWDENMPTEGFVPFWIGNSVTELTDGKAEVWITKDTTFSALDDADKTVEQWLQDKRHLSELPKGRFFVLTYGRVVDDPEYPAYTPLFLDESHMVYADDGITVYVFEDFDDYRNTLKEVEAKDAE